MHEKHLLVTIGVLGVESAKYSVYTFSGQVQAIYQLSVFVVKKNHVQFRKVCQKKVVLVLGRINRYPGRSRVCRNVPCEFTCGSR